MERCLGGATHHQAGGVKNSTWVSELILLKENNFSLSEIDELKKNCGVLYYNELIQRLQKNAHEKKMLEFLYMGRAVRIGSAAVQSKQGHNSYMKWDKQIVNAINTSQGKVQGWANMPKRGKF